MHLGDIWQLGYLPHRIQRHFESLALFEAHNAQDMLAELPKRGPEIVSCVWQVASLLPAPLPEEPSTQETCVAFINAAQQAAPENSVYSFGARAGRAERLLVEAYETSTLQADRDTNRRTLAGFAEEKSPVTDCPTLQVEDAVIAKECAKAVDENAPEALQAILKRVQDSARAEEAAAWGTPRQAIKDWHDKKLSAEALIRHFAEHQRWQIPARIENGQPVPRIMTLDKRVLCAFSDHQAVAARPSFFRDGSVSADDLYLQMSGAALFRWLPEDVDVLTFEATDDADSPFTVNYQREHRAFLRQTAALTDAELGATDWSHVQLEPMREHRYWVLFEDRALATPLAKNPYGRPLLALYSREEALEAHIPKLASAEKFAKMQRLLLPGSTLFPELAKSQMGMMLNPAGPWRTRAFNYRTVEKLTVEKLTVEKLTVEKLTVEKLTVEKLTVEKLTVEKLTVEKLKQ